MSFMGNKETRRKYKLQFDVFMTYIKEEAGGKVTDTLCAIISMTSWKTNLSELDMCGIGILQ